MANFRPICKCSCGCSNPMINTAYPVCWDCYSDSGGLCNKYEKISDKFVDCTCSCNCGSKIDYGLVCYFCNANCTTIIDIVVSANNPKKQVEVFKKLLDQMTNIENKPKRKFNLDED